MINSRSILAIIPARGGSKVLPRKNVLPLGGKPLIAWTIEAALATDYIDRTIVSTDNQEMATQAALSGCEVPFLRPPEIATDTATSAEVVSHALENLEDAYDWVLLLQPTSPFRNASHICQLIELMDSKNAKSAVSVVALDKSPEWMYWLDADSMELSPVLGENLARRRQDSRGAYLLNGAMYLIERELFLQNAAFVHPGTLACPMTKDDSVDIDTIEDLSAAEKMLADSMGLN